MLYSKQGMKNSLCLLLAVAMLLGACSPIKQNITENEAPMPEKEAQTASPPTPPDSPDPSEDTQGDDRKESFDPSEGGAPDEQKEPQEAPRENKKVRYLEVTASSLNVRTGAGTDYALLGRVARGELLAADGEADGWQKTLFCGRTAYVSAAYVRPVEFDASSSAREAVIREGAALLGTPYVYGAVRLHDGRGNFLPAFDETRFDCSSLMQYIFYRGAGLLLNVTTRTQVVQGTHVREEALERGDLMFFTNASRKDKTGLERVGHVALYLGDGYILHTASDFAKIEKLSPLRISYFLEARRML